MTLVVYALERFLAVLIVLTPLVSISCFTALSAGIDDRRTKSRIVLKTSIAVAVIMFAFLFGGNYLFQFFGVSIPAFQIAGGIIIFYNGFALVRAETRAKYTAEEAAEGTRKDDFAIVPLAIPMICGPATISTVVLYSAEAGDAAHFGALAVAVAAAAFAHYLMLRASAEVSRVLGLTGMNILTRISGLLLASIAVQIIIRGVAAVAPMLRGA